jgi:hypothetical protein
MRISNGTNKQTDFDGDGASVLIYEVILLVSGFMF